MNGLQFPFPVYESYRQAQHIAGEAAKIIESRLGGVEIELGHGSLPRKLTWGDYHEAQGGESGTRRIEAWSSGGVYTRILTREWDSAFGHHAEAATLRIHTRLRVHGLIGEENGWHSITLNASGPMPYIATEIASQVLAGVRRLAESQVGIGLQAPITLVIGDPDASDQRQAEAQKRADAHSATIRERAREIIALFS